MHPYTIPPSLSLFSLSLSPSLPLSLRLSLSLPLSSLSVSLSLCLSLLSFSSGAKYIKGIPAFSAPTACVNSVAEEKYRVFYLLQHVQCNGYSPL